MAEIVSEITVVIPARNAAATLAATLDSVLGQSRAPAAILVVDDGSTDATTQVVGRFAAAGVTLLTGPGRGVAAARNTGLRAAATEWVALLDADDTWRPGFLEAVSDALGASTTATVCFVAADAIDDEGRLIGVHAMPDGVLDGRRLISGELTPTTSAAVLSREHVLGLGGFFEGFERPAGVEDLDLWFRIAVTGTCIGISERLAAYVVHEARDRDRSADELRALERDREQVVHRLAERGQPADLVRSAAATMWARTARYWLIAGRRRDARRCARRSLRARVTVEGILTLTGAVAPPRLRERARAARRRYIVTRGGVPPSASVPRRADPEHDGGEMRR